MLCVKVYQYTKTKIESSDKVTLIHKFPSKAKHPVLQIPNNIEKANNGRNQTTATVIQILQIISS